jgi:hypothetical protein
MYQVHLIVLKYVPECRVEPGVTTRSQKVMVHPGKLQQRLIQKAGFPPGDRFLGGRGGWTRRSQIYDLYSQVCQSFPQVGYISFRSGPGLIHQIMSYQKDSQLSGGRDPGFRKRRETY